MAKGRYRPIPTERGCKEEDIGMLLVASKVKDGKVWDVVGFNKFATYVSNFDCIHQHRFIYHVSN